MAIISNELTWSASRASMFQSCPRKYYYNYYGSWGGWDKKADEKTKLLYVLKNVKPMILWAGSIVHDTIKESLLAFMATGRRPDAATLQQNATLKMRAGWIECVNKEWLDYWNIQSVAEPFRIEMPGLSKPVIGELDMVISEQTPFDDENDRGSDTIVDFKTAARMWSEDRPAKDLQATVFSYAFEKTHERRPSFRFDVVTKAKTPTVKHLYTSRDEDSYRRLEKLFLMADKGIQAGVFMPNESSFACSDCPFADHCSGWHCNSVHTAIPKAA